MRTENGMKVYRWWFLNIDLWQGVGRALATGRWRLEKRWYKGWWVYNYIFKTCDCCFRWRLNYKLWIFLNLIGACEFIMSDCDLNDNLRKGIQILYHDDVELCFYLYSQRSEIYFYHKTNSLIYRTFWILACARAVQWLDETGGTDTTPLAAKSEVRSRKFFILLGDYIWASFVHGLQYNRSSNIF